MFISILWYTSTMLETLDIPWEKLLSRTLRNGISEPLYNLSFLDYCETQRANKMQNDQKQYVHKHYVIQLRDLGNPWYCWGKPAFSQAAKPRCRTLIKTCRLLMNLEPLARKRHQNHQKSIRFPTTPRWGCTVCEIPYKTIWKLSLWASEWPMLWGPWGPQNCSAAQIFKTISFSNLTEMETGDCFWKTICENNPLFKMDRGW